jgi:hypothetical protein
VSPSRRAWPSKFPSLYHAEAQLDLEGGFNPRADDFTVALNRVAVPKVEKCARNLYGKPGLSTRPEAPIVHISTVLGAGGVGESLTEPWGYAKTPDHWLQRQD